MDNTGAKQAMLMQNKISDPEFIAITVGIAQLLEEYAEVSLDGQNLRFFPTSVMESVNTHMKQLRSLSDKWAWNSNPLKLAGIGCPKNIIQDLKDGFYRPFVSPGSIRHSQIKHNTTLDFQKQMQLDIGIPEDEVQDLLTWEVIAPLNEYGAGSFPVEGFTDDVALSVEDKLQKAARKLCDSFEQRFVKGECLDSAHAAFSVSACNGNYELLIKEVLDNIPGPNQDIFVFEEVILGYTLYVNMMCTEKALAQTNGVLMPKIETIWIKYWNKYGHDPNVLPFIELFQFVQGKSFSEAICETVGSIMNIHKGRGRNLHPVNYAKELYLRFNLGPTHILAEHFIPEIVEIKTEEENKSYFTKAPLAKLKYDAWSSTIGNFRVNEVEKCHLPCDFFQ
jgi:hypothetical protein